MSANQQNTGVLKVLTLINENTSSVSATFYGNLLYIGTENGNLYIFEKTGRAQDFQFIRKVERFGDRKTSVQFLHSETTWGIYFALRDIGVEIHKGTDHSLLSVLPKSKGATCICVIRYSGIIVVGMDKALILYKYNQNKDNSCSVDLFDTVPLNHTPKQIVGNSDTICISFKTNYVLFDVTSRKVIKELIPSNNRPLILLVTNEFNIEDSQVEFLLIQNQSGYFVDLQGNPTRSSQQIINYSNLPDAICLLYPYILTKTNKFIEIHSCGSCNLIQIIPLCNHIQSVSYVDKDGKIYQYGILMGSDNISICELKPPNDQINFMITHTPPLYQESLLIASLSNYSVPQSTIFGIHYNYSLYLFNKGEFKLAYQHFMLSKRDINEMIAMLPCISPAFLPASTKPHPLSDEKTKSAVQEMIIVLEEYRKKTYEVILKPEDQEKAKIVDTTLFNGYVYLKSDHLANFIKSKTYIDIELCEAKLKENQLHDEMVILYQYNSNHRAALSQLFPKLPEVGEKLNSKQLAALKNAVYYLQALDNSETDLILEYARAILPHAPDLGVQIFTNNTTKNQINPEDVYKIIKSVTGANLTQRISKDKSYSYLKNIPLIEYLKFRIYNKNDSNVKFHNELIYLYMESILKLSETPADLSQTLLDIREHKRDSNQSGLAGQLHRELIAFLKYSKFYDAKEILSNNFPDTDLLEERAIIYSSLNRHEEALHIYINQLNDIELAEKYCNDFYDVNNPDTKTLFNVLLKLLFYSTPNQSYPKLKEERLHNAYSLFGKYSTKLDIDTLFDTLPKDESLHKVLPSISTLFRRLPEIRRSNQISQNILKFNNFDFGYKLMNLEKNKIVITKDTKCQKCDLHIGNSTFVRRSNNLIYHYGCSKELEQQ